MKIALAGFGQEGRASYEYWDKDGNELTVADERESVDGLPEGVKTILGPDAFSKLGDFDLIIRSPSVNPKKLPYGDKVWSATNEFFEKCPAPIIGVTGTKGKGTTSSLIASILKLAGRTVHLVGNIGVPALSELSKIEADHVIVYELSSFQLWDLKKGPNIAVVLMIEPDHLDVHDNLNDYLRAKANICRNMPEGSKVYVYSENELSRTVAVDMGDNHDNLISYQISGASYAGVVHADNYFRYGQDVIAPVGILKIPGRHNIDNACAAIAVALNFTEDYNLIAKGLASYDGLDHRLKFIRQVSGVSYYDDSIATTPGSAIAALRSFNESHKIIILGGSDKGADYDELIKTCESTDTEVVAIGSNRGIILKLCQQYQVFAAEVAGGMKEIVSTARSLAEDGDVVILSPAAASFDMFKSYADRGDQFIAAVNKL